MLQEIWFGFKTNESGRTTENYNGSLWGPYQLLETYSNHTYKIEKQGLTSVQNESRLKLYYTCTEETERESTNQFGAET